MRARVLRSAAAVVLTAGLALTGCTSGAAKRAPSTTSNKPSGRVATSGAASTATGSPALLGGGSTAHLSGFCAKLVAAGLKLNAAQTALYDGGSAGALTMIISDLKDLESGAPADIRAALEDMRSAFQSAQQVLAHNNVTESSAEFAKVGPRLEKDDKLISQYSASKCDSS